MIAALLNQKGGVGKTTLALHLAGAWAAGTGHTGHHRARDRDRSPRDPEDRAMTRSPAKPGFTSRPGNPDSWVRVADAPATGKTAGEAFTARLTIDITPELRGRIKVAAFRRGITVTVMLREMLGSAFPSSEEDPS